VADDEIIVKIQPHQKEEQVAPPTEEQPVEETPSPAEAVVSGEGETKVEA
jgi:hypothetical protein